MATLHASVWDHIYKIQRFNPKPKGGAGYWTDATGWIVPTTVCAWFAAAAQAQDPSLFRVWIHSQQYGTHLYHGGNTGTALQWWGECQ